MPYWYKDDEGNWHYATNKSGKAKHPVLTDEQEKALNALKREGVEREIKEGESPKEAFERIQGERKEARTKTREGLGKYLPKTYKESLPKVSKENRQILKKVRRKEQYNRTRALALKGRVGKIEEQIAANPEAENLAELQAKKEKLSGTLTERQEKAAAKQKRREKLTKHRADKLRGLTTDAYGRQEGAPLEEGKEAPASAKAKKATLFNARTETRAGAKEAGLAEARKSRMYQESKKRLRRRRIKERASS